MAEHWRRPRHPSWAILGSLALALLVVGRQLMAAEAAYLPEADSEGGSDPPNDPDESDGDDVDTSASQQQPADDGYEDNEREETPYDETPREVEGQADLERFFDDHLGASEKEGMDGENLPSNLDPTLLDPAEQGQPDVSSSHGTRNRVKRHSNASDHPIAPLRHKTIAPVPAPVFKSASRQVPDEELLAASSQRFQQAPHFRRRSHFPVSVAPPNRINVTALPSDVITTEDDSFDRVYVTENSKKPFKIDALGGYDPEEDFQAASEAFDDSAGAAPARDRPESSQGDISFSDPEADTLFEDAASETDEVTFAHEPYQTDLEAELQAQQLTNLLNAIKLKQLAEAERSPETRADSRGTSEVDDPADNSTPEVDNQEAGEASNLAEMQRRLTMTPETARMLRLRAGPSEEDSEGNWINDGADDMEIPSQKDQERVLALAAQQEALAAKKGLPDPGHDENAQDSVEQADPRSEPESMEPPEEKLTPNANYMTRNPGIEAAPIDRDEDETS